MEEIKVEHPNGYSGILYGKRSMVIFYKGEEVLHTGFRNENLKTKEDLYKELEEMPEFLAMLDKAFEDDEEENTDI